ncbi:hypothetical protein MCEMSEM23_02984 [Rhabdaerophilaceae bacterium]
MSQICFKLTAAFALLCLTTIHGAGQTQREPRLTAILLGAETILYNPARQGCDANDIPDSPLRAYRDETGAIAAFALHFDNRRLSGAAFDKLRLECAIVFRGSGNGDPKRYDDRAWIAATYTEDGSTVFGLVHHEFQADKHPSRCSRSVYIECWWNSILAIRSQNGGREFSRAQSQVMAASSEPSESGQGRHRGFFNPSNIIKFKDRYFTLIATTGWAGQTSGVCLFRSSQLGDGADWAAFDGTEFKARFPDPYSTRRPASGACKPVGPFPAPVGSITQHAGSGLFLAVFQAAKGMPDGQGSQFPVSGFYLATSPDLLRWSPPERLLATRSLYDNPCGESLLRTYPSIIDPASGSRNFDTTGDTALLTFTEIIVEGCTITHQRRLVGQPMRISRYFVE